jgi:hypothetical protein
MMNVGLRKGETMSYEKCKDCGDVLGTNSLCSGACKAESDASYQEPDFERLLELKRDADAVAREGFGNEWSL